MQATTPDLFPPAIAALAAYSSAPLLITDATRTILWCNDAFTRLTGYALEGIRGKSPKQFLQGPGTDPNTSAAIRDALVRDGHFEGEILNYTREGRAYWTHLVIDAIYGPSGEVSHYVGVQNEVTERRLAEQWNKALLDATRDAFVATDLDGKITVFNAAAERLLGWRAQDVIGKETPTLYHDPASVAVLRTHLEAQGVEVSALSDVQLFFTLASDPALNTSLEGTVIARDGARIPITLLIQPMFDPQGIQTGYLWIMRDVREREEHHILQDRLTHIAARIPGMMYQFRLAPDGTMHFPYASEGIRKIYEVAPEDVKVDANVIMNRLHPEDRQAVMDSINTSAETLSLWQVEYRVVLPALGVRWLRGESYPRREKDGSVIWYGYITDITESRQREIALQELRTRHLIATEAAQLGIWEYQIAADKLIWDSTMHVVYGTNPERQVETLDLWKEVTLGEDMLPTLALFQRSIALGEPFSTEFRIRRPNTGDVRWIRAEGHVVCDADGAPLAIIGINDDITQRKQAEQALAEQERRLRTLLNSFKDLVFVLDAEMRIRDFYASPSSLLWTQPDLFIGKTNRELQFPEEATALIEGAVRYTLETGELGECDYALPEGNDWIWFNLQSTLLQVAGQEEPWVTCVIRDITLRKNAESALEQERDLFTSGPVIALSFDTEPGWPVRFVSNNVERILGYTSGFLLQRHFLFLELVHPDDRGALLHITQKLEERHREQEAMPFRVRHADGTWRWVSSTLHLHYGRDGSLMRVDGYLLDQTDHIETSRLLREEQERLAHIIEGTQAGTWEWDLVSGKATYNALWASYMGYTLDELEPINIHSWKRHCHPEDKPAVLRALEAHLRGQSERYDVEYRVQHRDGHWIWVNDRGRIVEQASDGAALRMFGSHIEITQRKQAQQEREQAMALLDRFFSVSLDLLCITQHDGAFVRLNTAWSQVLGYAPDELIQRTLHDVVHPEDRALTVEALRGLQEGTAVTQFVNRLRHAEGSYRVMEWRAQAIDNLVYAAARDVTETREAQEALQQSRARFASVVQAQQELIARFLPDTTLTFVNTAFARAFHITKDERALIHTKWSAFLSDAHAQLLQRHIALLTPAQPTSSFATRVELSSGRVAQHEYVLHGFWNKDGTLAEVQSIGRDVTELTQTREFLARTSALARVGGWEYDLDTHTMVWTDVTYALHEVPWTYVPTLANELLFYREGYSRDTFGRCVREALMDGTSWQEEVELVTAKGNVLWVRTSGHVERHNGRIVRIYGTLQDIDALKRTEINLTEAKSRAEAASEAKSNFLANMSHEIRTPLNGVLGMAELLLGTPLNAQQEQWVRTLMTSGEGLLTILNDILDYSRIESGRLPIDLIPFDPTALLYSALEPFRIQMQGRETELIVQVDPAIPQKITGDPGRIRQILNNLVGNAVKFTHSGHVIVKLELQASTWSLKVQDTGIGIPEDRKAALFQPFEQVDNSTARKYGGSGLGLAISRKLAHLLGGHISMESTMGVGSEFCVTLPLLPVEPAHTLPALIDAPELFLVAQQPLHREHLNALFQQAGGRVTAVASPDEASPIEPNLVVFVLSERDLEALAQLRSRFQNTPLLALSPTLTDTLTQACINLGLRGLLPTVLPPHDLLLLVKRAIETSTPFLTPNGLQESLPQSHPLPADRPLQGLHILLAEDNRINQQVAKLLLERLGADVDVVEDGEAAVEFITHIRPDMILMDVQMPGMDGFEATQRIRIRESLHDAPPIPIIALTANAMAGDRERCLAAGMDDYLSKPLREQDLVRVLARNAAPVADAKRETMAEIDPDMQAMIFDLDPDGARELYHELAARIPETLEALRTAQRDADWKALRHEAHTLKGAASSLGCTLLAEEASAVEQCALREESVSLEALKAVAERTLQAIVQLP